MYVCMAVLGLHFCARAFSSCGERGHSSSRAVGLSLSQPLPLRSTGSRRAGSVVVAHGPSCSAACGIFPDQGPNPCPLHWQADSQPLHHQGSLGQFNRWKSLVLICISWVRLNIFSNIQEPFIFPYFPVGMFTFFLLVCSPYIFACQRI